MKRLVKIGVAVLVIMVIITGLIACNDDTEKSTTTAGKSTTAGEKSGTDVPDNLNVCYPIVKEPITLKAFGIKMYPDISNSEIVYLKELEELTNIKLEWQEVPAEAYEEQVNLKFASDDLPDIFTGGNLTRNNEITYGVKGKQLIPLNDLIGKYALNLQKVMQINPTIEPTITLYDGNIYTLPYIREGLIGRTGAFHWLEKAALEAVNRPIPTTTDELIDTLIKIKNEYKPADGKEVLPWAGVNTDFEGLKAVSGSFGIMENKNHIDVKDGKVRYVPLYPEYKELISFWATIYKNDLINKDFITVESLQPHTENYHIAGTCYHPFIWGAPDWTIYTPVPPLKGPNGEQKAYAEGNMVQTYGTFAITSECKYPEAAIRWADTWFTDDAIIKNIWGKEGVQWKRTNIGSMVNLPADQIPEDVSHYTPYVRLSWPLYFSYQVDSWSHSIADVEPEAAAPNTLVQLQAIRGRAKYVPDENKNSLPLELPFTEEESNAVIGYIADLNNYVDAMKAKLITGQESFDSWDSFVAQVERLGGRKVEEIYQAAYDRWASYIKY